MTFIWSMAFPFRCVNSVVRLVVAVFEAKHYGYCAAKQQTYYGFHGHLLLTATGVITGFTLTPANASEREALWDMVQMINGLLIGDQGYRSAPLQQELRQMGINLETALRSNMQDSRNSAWVA